VREDVRGLDGRHVILGDTSPTTLASSEVSQANHVYVWPPGQWAESPEQAVRLLRDNL
jgi:hypothetical protein